MILSLLALIIIACVTQAQLVPEFAKITKGCIFTGELPSSFDQCAATSSGATAAVRCCEDIDPSTVTCDSPNCDFESVTFLFAQEVCANASMRLCTEREIDIERECCSAGCGFDNDPVWTADECVPTPAPTSAPTNSPTPVPSPSPTTAPSPQPTDSPTSVPSPEPTNEPTVPSPQPTNAPTDFPTRVPTGAPTVATASPTVATTSATVATASPTVATTSPTGATASPTVATASPTVATASPTQSSEQEISAATSYRQAESSALWATTFSMILAAAALTR